MSLKATVARIIAEVEALPAEARAEIIKDRAWSATHPVIYAVALISTGYVLALLSVWFV